MNLRVLKKLSKRAAPFLPLFGDHREQFRALKGESYHGMAGFPLKNWVRSPCHPTYEPAPWDCERFRKDTVDGRSIVISEPHHPLKGTIMVGGMSGYFEREWSEETAWGSLREIVRWHFTEYDKVSGDLEPTRRLDTPSQVFRAAQDMIAERSE